MSHVRMVCSGNESERESTVYSEWRDSTVYNAVARTQKIGENCERTTLNDGRWLVNFQLWERHVWICTMNVMFSIGFGNVRLFAHNFNQSSFVCYHSLSLRTNFFSPFLVSQWFCVGIDVKLRRTYSIYLMILFRPYKSSIKSSTRFISTRDIDYKPNQVLCTHRPYPQYKSLKRFGTELNIHRTMNISFHHITER